MNNDDKSKQEVKLESHDDSVEVMHFSPSINASFNEILDYKFPEIAAVTKEPVSQVEDKGDTPDEQLIFPHFMAPFN